MKNKTKLTNSHVISEGTLLYDYPCDVGMDDSMESNGSIECIYELQGKTYAVVCDWDKNPRFPSKTAQELEGEE